MPKRNTCAWCLNPNADDVDDPETLCRSHLAEHEGTTVYGLEAQEDGWAYDSGRMYG